MPAYSISDQVKIAILIVTGDNSPDPSTLSDDQDMGDLRLNAYNYIRLTAKLNIIAKLQNTDADTINETDVENAGTVKDVVGLVTAVLN